MQWTPKIREVQQKIIQPQNKCQSKILLGEKFKLHLETSLWRIFITIREQGVWEVAAGLGWPLTHNSYHQSCPGHAINIQIFLSIYASAHIFYFPAIKIHICIFASNPICSRLSGFHQRKKEVPLRTGNVAKPVSFNIGRVKILMRVNEGSGWTPPKTHICDIFPNS